MTRYRHVSTMKAEGFPVSAACDAAEVSTSAYYDWLDREAAGPTPAQLDEAYLTNHIHDIHAESDSTYGCPRVTKELRRSCHAQLERLRRRFGVQPPELDNGGLSEGGRILLSDDVAAPTVVPPGSPPAHPGCPPLIPGTHGTRTAA